MILNGKCKEDFEKWYIEKYHSNTKNKVTLKLYLIVFWDLCDSKKYGILVDFFDSVGIRIDLLSVGEPTMQGFNFFGHRFLINGFKANLTFIKTRQEARTKAIEKANECYNER